LSTVFCSDRLQFEVADSSLQHLHTIIALQKLAREHRLPAPLSIILLPAFALETSAAAFLLGATAPPRSLHRSPPPFQPLRFRGEHSHLQLTLSFTFDKAAAAVNIRAFFIPSVSEYLAFSACPDDQQRIISSLLTAMPSAQLFPPPSWQQLTCRKDAVFARFGSEFMLPAQWISIPSLDSLQSAADAMLEGRSNGTWMVKGSFSACTQTAFRLKFHGGRCEALLPTLGQLFTKYHQRCVGIQPFVQDLRDFELRVFLVPDAASPLRWRQCVSVQTRSTSSSHSNHLLQGGLCHAELLLPTHGRPLLIAAFIDTLLTKRADFFTEALALRTPLLRLDCGYQSATKRCFLNELVSAVNCGCYSAVHGQDLACVIGEGLASGLWRSMS
jgi:hypothetical protein